LATDSDRIFPGDGDFCFRPLLERFGSLGYDGWISLELLNPTLWQAQAAQVAQVGLTALKNVLSSCRSTA
jgi:sugar phosphate isomerase/epimerase